MRHGRNQGLVAALFVLLPPTIGLAAGPSVFDHRQHQDDAAGFPECVTCHTESAGADVARPGKEGHAICDAAECHASEFSPLAFAKTELCTTCHLKKARVRLENNLKPFPPEKQRLDYYAEFSHESHLVTRVKKKLKDTCLDCHLVEAKTKEVTRPGHQQCASCHDSKSKVPMSACADCHRFRRDEKGAELAVGPRGRSNPCRVTGKFSHDQHRLDRRAKTSGKVVGCGQCHFGLEKASSLAAIIPTNGRQTMLNACGSCHRSGQMSAGGKAVVATSGDCMHCHQAECLSAGPLPSWHQ